jgi:DNA-binding transcriptional MocR family regulator
MQPRSYRIVGTGYSAIAASVEQGIALGALPPGWRLPPVRQLAAELSVSTGTVAAAYRLLSEHRLVVGRGRGGTVVVEWRPRALRRLGPLVPDDAVDLASGAPDPVLLPDLRPALAALTEALGSAAGRSRTYGEAALCPELRDVLMQDFATRRLPVKDIGVVSGTLDGIQRALSAWTRPGDRVAVEDPAYSGLLDVLDSHALLPVPVSMDADGALPDDLRAALKQRPAAVVFTPRGQNPTGAAWTSRRAHELSSVLVMHPQVLIIEDDPLGDLSGAPLYSVAATGAMPRWAHLRGLNKSLGPDMRIAGLAADPITLARVEAHQQAGVGWVSWLLQRLAHQLLTDPSFPRLLTKASSIYARRRDALAHQLRGYGLDAHAGTGLNVWLVVPREAVVVQAALSEGWAIRAGEDFRVESQPGVRITAARLQSERAPELAGVLARAVQGQRHTV